MDKHIRAFCILALFTETSYSFDNAFTLARISSEKHVITRVFMTKGPEIWFGCIKSSLNSENLP